MRFTIGRKIGIGFGIFILATIILLVITSDTVDESKMLNDEMTQVSNPSVKTLEELKVSLEQTKTLIVYWVYFQSRSDIAEKTTLRRIIKEDIPKIQYQIDDLEENWDDKNDAALKASIYNKMEELMALYTEVMELLPDFESYEPEMPFDLLRAFELAEDDGVIDEVYDPLIADLNKLIDNQRIQGTQMSNEMQGSFERLNTYLTYLGIALIIAGIAIAVLTTRSITRPVSKLKTTLLNLGKGVIPQQRMDHSNDEIGDMTEALNSLMAGMTRTRDFVSATGSGNFGVDYVPLSERDEMGQAVLKMRNDLFELTSDLEQKVVDRTKTIEEQKAKVSELYEDITASIRYAKRIQNSILPSDEKIKKIFPNSFVYFRPKDIVSGDFYWFHEMNGYKYMAAVDCTGHGVPGAFMSLIAHNSIDQIVKSTGSSDPGEILSLLNDASISGLNRQMEDLGVRDGMDMSLCIWDQKTSKLSFAGAGRPLYFFKDGKLQNVKGDRYAIGNSDYLGIKFKSQSFEFGPGDLVYQFSDGYVDQFGGEKEGGTKFKFSRFRSLLNYIQPMEMHEQHEEVNKAMMNWMADKHEQIDDILVIGVRF